MINDINYKKILIGFSLVLISGDGCPNCIAMKPILNQIVTNNNDINLYYVDLSKKIENIIKKYEILSVPTILFLHNDILIDKVTGFQPQEILELWIDYKMKAFL